jgi:hypothetical protein
MQLLSLSVLKSPQINCLRTVQTGMFRRERHVMAFKRIFYHISSRASSAYHFDKVGNKIHVSAGVASGGDGNGDLLGIT